MYYVVKLYSSLGKVLAEYMVITGSRGMAVESAIIQYRYDWRMNNDLQLVDKTSVRIAEGWEIPQ